MHATFPAHSNDYCKSKFNFTHLHDSVLKASFVETGCVMEGEVAIKRREALRCASCYEAPEMLQYLCRRNRFPCFIANSVEMFCPLHGCDHDVIPSCVSCPPHIPQSYFKYKSC